MPMTAVMPAVLLAEDDMLISLDVCSILDEAGYSVLGPAATIVGAVSLLASETPHLAIVDVLLRDGPCTELAKLLRVRNVPFLIYSGYGRYAGAIEGFRGAPWLAKPASPDEIIKRLVDLV